MPEGIELPEGHHEGGDHPLVLPVSITISIMAVLVAGVTLLGHRAHTEELLHQSQAADKWAQYQATWLLPWIRAKVKPFEKSI